MELITDIASFPKGTFAATIGFFDGVHVGHRFLLNKLKEEAKKRGKKTLVISFDVHPKTVLSTNYLPPLLTTNEEKIALIEEENIDACVLLHFDQEMANLTAHEFLGQIIAKKLGVDVLLIGYNHRFGKNREEGFEAYVEYGKQLGIDVLSAEAYNNDKTHISSSVVRRLLLNGFLEDANTLLTRPYKLSGVVIAGQKLGRKLGFPTANLEISDSRKLIPEGGVYAVQIKIKDALFKGMLNIGKRPTVSKTSRTTIEVHILNFDEDIYNETIEVFFIKKIRNEIKFKSLDDLVLQLNKDKQFVSNLEF